jgi:parallel beta-helix repeat protein
VAVATRKSVLSAFFIGTIIGAALGGTAHFAMAQNGTNVIGIITLDTTWTKANSPYIFTGPVGIATGATLKIEPGVTINLGNYYIIVNGTLQAVGTNIDQIHFNGGTTGMLSPTTLNYAITLAPSSGNWNEQTRSGCAIENSILNSTTIMISNSSPKIYNNTIDGSIRIQERSTGSPIISDNSIVGIVRPWGVPDEPIEDDSSYSALISNNTITSGVSSSGTSDGIAMGANDVVYGNIISGCYSGIIAPVASAIISDNIVSNCQIGIRVTFGSATVENNLITNDTQTGIVLGSGSFKVQNNTITNNGVGIQPSPSSTIINNNIQGNIQYSIRLSQGTSNNVNAAYNWWGTLDPSAINQSIYDGKYDFNLGTVNFIPFLTAPNPQAIPNASSTPTPTPPPAISPTPSITLSPSESSSPSTSTSPPPTTSIPEFPSWIILPLFTVAALTLTIVKMKLRRRRPKT